ncbi:MAG: hypothetical protein ACYTHJ_17960 [Planctomycetota bacterium]
MKCTSGQVARAVRWLRVWQCGRVVQRSARRFATAATACLIMCIDVGCSPAIRFPDINIEFSLFGVFLDAMGTTLTM